MDKEEQFIGSFSTPFFLDLNSHLLNGHHLSTLLAANHRLHHCTPETKEQEVLMETLMKLPAIGLKLQISPSFLKQMQRSKQSKRKRINHATQTRADDDGERLKASILGAMMLQVGSWQLLARNEGDLVAKFYFAKRQLVWEILRHGLKEKIEIDWSNIIGIQAFMEENKPGILEVELSHPPKYYKEMEPEPRKHTQWTDGSDFTEGEASINRRHCIVFPPRVLDKHYQKLLDKDKHLFELSQRPFPTFNFPYFPSPAVNFNQISAIQFEEMRSFKIPSFPLHIAAGAIDTLTSPRSDVNYTQPFNEIRTQQDQRIEMINRVNTARRYEAEAEAEVSANYYNEGKAVNNGYGQGFYSANPMASLVWFEQNSEVAANLSQQPSSSFDHIEYFNGTVMKMRALQVPSGQCLSYNPTY